MYITKREKVFFSCHPNKYWHTFVTCFNLGYLLISCIERMDNVKVRLTIRGYGLL